MTAATLILSLALSHGGGEHIMGTVKAVEDTVLTVETKDSKTVKVALDPATKFDREGKSATAKDIAVGDRVVVHAAKADGSEGLRATLVKLSARKSPP
jgi:hypothetical protein